MSYYARDYGRRSRSRNYPQPKYRRYDDDDHRNHRRTRRRRDYDDHDLDKQKEQKDDSVGHYEGGRGDVLIDRHEILGDAGTGTFGRVVECFDRKRRRRVAVKIVRRIQRYTESAAVEAGILRDVNRLADRDVPRDERRSPESSLIVQLYSTFYADGHFCLVFEKLGASLYEVLKMNDYRPFLPRSVVSMARQILESLAFLHSMALVHTDLKLENVLLRSSELLDDTSSTGTPLKVPKSDQIVLIDFGGATYDHERKATVINTRQYRAPEVILDVGWSMPSDLWSAGCIVAELNKGELLFATHSNTLHIGLMERLVGPFPKPMLHASKYKSRYFDRDGLSNWPVALNRQGRDHVRNMPRLADYCGPDNKKLYRLLRGLLVIDPHDRFTAQEALQRADIFFPYFSIPSVSNPGSSSSHHHLSRHHYHPLDGGDGGGGGGGGPPDDLSPHGPVAGIPGGL